MATLQKPKQRRNKKIKPQEEESERPASSLSQGWVGDEGSDSPKPSLQPSTAALVPSPQPSIAGEDAPIKNAGSFVSVKEAADQDKSMNVDQIEDELEHLKEDDQPIAESNCSLLSVNGNKSTEPNERPASATSGKYSVDGSKKIPSNVIVPYDGEIITPKRESNEAWSDSSMVDLKKRPQTADSKPNLRTRSPGQGTHTGSVPSMHTVISIEEAKPEHRIDDIGPETSVNALMQERNQDDNKSLVSTTSIVRIPPPQLEKEQQAYVPFLYARDSLEKVMRDMKRMKMNHIKIVSDIQDAYRAIENETQAQFNVFVIGLRTDYRGKVKTFRQVVEVHREELVSREAYWQETLQSLSQRNKELLKEKRKLLLINKMEIERLEKEKAVVVADLTSKVDAEHQQVTNASKDHDNMLDAHMVELKEIEETHQQEKKILEDQLTSEKEEKLRLQRMLQSRPGETVVVAEDTGTYAAPVAAVLMTDEEKKRLEEENIRLKAERDQIQQYKDQYQEKMIDSQKETAMYQAKFNTLHLQYLAIAKVSEENKDKIDQEIMAVVTDKQVMDEEQTSLKEDITKWEKEFEERTGKTPTEADKPDSVHELETQLHEVEIKQKELEGKTKTLTMLKEGKVPEVAEADVPEPIIKTVEVTVPDPVTVAALAASHAKLKDLEEQLKKLTETVDHKAVMIKKLENELKNKKISGAGSNEVDPGLKVILQSVIKHIQLIHENNDPAKTQVSNQLTEEEAAKAGCVTATKDLQDQLDAWEKLYREEHDIGPTEADRDASAQQLYASFETSQQKQMENEVDITALTMIQTGVIPDKFGGITAMSFTGVSGGGGGANQEELDEANEKNEDLEKEIEELKRKINELQEGSGGGASLAITSGIDVDDDDIEGFNAQLGDLQKQVDNANDELRQEKSEHEKTRDELEDLKSELEKLKQEQTDLEVEYDGKIKASTVALVAELEIKNKSLDESKQRIDELEKEKLSALPPDVAKEIQLLQAKLAKSEKEKEDLQKSSIGGNAEVEKIKLEIATLSQSLAKEREVNRGHQENLKKKMAEKDKQLKEQQIAIEKKYQQREDENKKQLKSLEKKIKELSVAGVAMKPGAKGAKGGAAVDAKTEKKLKLLQDQIATLKKKAQEDQAKIKELTDQLKDAKSDAFGDKQAGKKQEKAMKDLEKKIEMETKKFERELKKANELEEELKTTKKERDSANEEVKKLTAQIAALGIAAEQAVELKEKAEKLEKEVKELQAENKLVTENFNSERVLRKKYYNMVEDMKGKIRVFCRARPLSGSEKERGCNIIVNAPDEYTVSVESSRGLKEFQFDRIFMAENTQEDVFEDTNNLVQTAVDGYNVCIFAYGQTGSGKTFTMIGDRDQKFPGIAPRAFEKIFEVIEENKSKYSFKVYTYMLELYNDKLIDLYAKGKEDKLDIKKDKKGMVVVNGSVILEASNHKELYGLFEQGSSNRHVASTKMNSESSRSHLVLAIIIESTNLSTGTVVKGKLSLVDLAGSERAAKTEASAQQLKEANSINKSLSALGDVISALSSEQSFIPYRNNKLTLLMQDSLGGNAKTLMFVNVSPADYNADETVISLTYASRVKLITNDASKNADNKEIARLKDVINKLKSGENVDEEVAS
ncbi:uncharacterized protein [Antedon mediterranea]|uniref:uncharacterized protein n=1 Tax=Antedon mediterranea TaxID=105859 RepID=UPI003AF77DA9